MSSFGLLLGERLNRLSGCFAGDGLPHCLGSLLRAGLQGVVGLYSSSDKLSLVLESADVLIKLAFFFLLMTLFLVPPDTLHRHSIPCLFL